MAAWPGDTPSSGAASCTTVLAISIAEKGAQAEFLFLPLLVHPVDGAAWEDQPADTFLSASLFSTFSPFMLCFSLLLAGNFLESCLLPPHWLLSRTYTKPANFPEVALTEANEDP